MERRLIITCAFGFLCVPSWTVTLIHKKIFRAWHKESSPSETVLPLLLSFPIGESIRTKMSFELGLRSEWDGVLGDISDLSRKWTCTVYFWHQYDASAVRKVVFPNDPEEPGTFRGLSYWCRYNFNGTLSLLFSKARTLFEKNAAPILHLSGMDVTVVKTDYEGQAKKLLELMENTDVIIVAGGDGTLQEVMAAFLFETILKATFSKIPIGFIPLGQTSSLSHTLFAESGNKVQRITDATLAVVKGETIPLDVLQIKGEKEQPVFALTGLRWGSFRDAGVTVSKSGLRLIKPRSHTRDLQRDPPVEQKRPLHGPPCTGEYYEGSRHTGHNRRTSKEDFMNICMEPNTVSKGDFITVGSKKVRDPRLHADGTECLRASRCTLLLPEGTGGSFSIDSEEYEAMPVEVKLLPRKLQFFCDPRKREEMLQGAAQVMPSLGFHYLEEGLDKQGHQERRPGSAASSIVTVSDVGVQGCGFRPALGCRSFLPQTTFLGQALENS
ncbi:acylglycerol kinase, mitochondrial [Camelus ferus]|nr:acylglycerol kinase, mitochondrial [Camelus ferus]